MLPKAWRSITAPMKLLKSAGSPTRISATCARSTVSTRGQSEAGVKKREAAGHFWAWDSKAPRVGAVASAGTPAEAGAETEASPALPAAERGGGPWGGAV